eukprot:CAMPEP_0114557680 /NCGR_PEP_ID=MMETSP0114-20121206/9962_1 /TAXON_ID=31324 /ORGANISM="Goniomonas sp, Strain m" /LENGTH=408 /DNA_ID=CAMNT_0001742989 /DNA_START=1 /DNA_END=1227 /DNA_ORIENTATION=+
MGITIDGIWHTGVCVFGREFYYGGGICQDFPAQTPYGSPVDVVEIGTTTKTHAELLQFLSSIQSSFTAETYDLLNNNCNNFSTTVTRFLTGQDIPQHILDLPEMAMSTPLGAMIRPQIEAAQSRISEQSSFSAVPGVAQHSGEQDSSTPYQEMQQPHQALRGLLRTPVLLTKAEIEVVKKKLEEFLPGAGTSVKELREAVDSLGPAKCFPALDLLRLAAARDLPSNAEVAPHLLHILKTCAVPAECPRPTRMMALRTLVNAFAFEPGAKALLSDPEGLAEAVAVGLAAEQHNAVKLAAAMLACNAVGAQSRFPGSVALPEEVHIRLAYVAGNALAEVRGGSDAPMPPEAAGVELYCLGTLGQVCLSDNGAKELVQTLDVDLARRQKEPPGSDPLTAALATDVAAILKL